jgi:hypothetical protein
MSKILKIDLNKSSSVNKKTESCYVYIKQNGIGRLKKRKNMPGKF